MLTSPGFVLIILQVTQPKVNSPTSNSTPYPNPLRGVAKAWKNKTPSSPNRDMLCQKEDDKSTYNIFFHFICQLSYHTAVKIILTGCLKYNNIIIVL